MNLTGLHLLLSYQCTYECDHCFVHSSPRARGTMTLEFVRDAIRQAAGLGTITETAFEGGEPFLFYPILLGGVREAARHGFAISIVSNGYFATSVEDAVEYLRPIQEIVHTTPSRRKSTLSLSISDDDYHGGGEDSPAARARAAADLLGIDCSEITIDQPCVVVHDKEKGEPILGGGVRFRGRAAVTLANDPTLPRRPWHEFNECPDEDWLDLGRLHLDGYGNLFSCQGVVIGNLNLKPLAKVIAEYDPHAHPIVGPLMTGGPAGLVRRFDLKPEQESYLDACQLCYEARRALSSSFPDELAPPHVLGLDESTVKDGVVPDA